MRIPVRNPRAHLQQLQVSMGWTVPVESGSWPGSSLCYSSGWDLLFKWDWWPFPSLKIRLAPGQARKSNFDGLRGIFIPFIPNCDTRQLRQAEQLWGSQEGLMRLNCSWPEQSKECPAASRGRCPSPGRKQPLPSSSLIQHHMNNSNIHNYLE